MICSARSRLNREDSNRMQNSAHHDGQSLGSASAPVGFLGRSAYQAGGAPVLATRQEGSDLVVEKPLKHVNSGAFRDGAHGVGRQRQAHTGEPPSCVSRASENVATNVQHMSTAPTTVLGDVTNTAACQQWPPLGCPASSLAASFCSKLAPPTREHSTVRIVAPRPTQLPQRQPRGDVDTDPPASGSFSHVALSQPGPQVQKDTVQSETVEDPQCVSEYLPDILRRMRERERRWQPRSDFLEKQPQVSSRMRGILVDWLVDVHKKYKLRPETLFLAANLIDGFLEKKRIVRQQLQLVAVVALLIASKFEDVHPPQIQDLVFLTDKAYSRDELVAVESTMLNALGFEICRPTAFHFLEQYLHGRNFTEVHRNLAQYLMELTLLHHRMVGYPPACIAAASVLVSNRLLQQQPAWPPTLAALTEMTEPMLFHCAEDIYEFLRHAQHSPLQAVIRKFSQSKFHSVAKMKFGRRIVEEEICCDPAPPEAPQPPAEPVQAASDACPQPHSESLPCESSLVQVVKGDVAVCATIPEEEEEAEECEQDGVQEEQERGKCEKEQEEAGQKEEEREAENTSSASEQLLQGTVCT